MLPQQTTVLVVGAGPTGLAAATSLAFQGCKDLVIVDAVERNMRPLSSRALAVHAATLEVCATVISYPSPKPNRKSTVSRYYPSHR